MTGFPRFFACAAALLGAGVLAATSAAASDGADPLFADSDVIDLTITAPFGELIRRAESSTDPYPAELSLAGAAPEAHPITLSARGNSRRRRDLCRFPPLRIAFDDKPAETSLFDGQKRLKLVTHCKRTERFQQYYLKEYLAYRFYNVLTPLSLKVRMAQINYVEEKNGKTLVTRYGFLIEDTDDAAKRNGVKEIDTPDIDLDQLSPTAAARYAVFQYMIGNLDWSMHSGPDDEDCCHNTKLVGAGDAPWTDLTPIPYDFDYSGLVDAPYAIPPESVSVRSVTQRRYRGFCVHNSEALAAAAQMRALEPTLLAEVDAAPGLTDRARGSVRHFLGKFFDAVADDETVENRILDDCRK